MRRTPTIDCRLIALIIDLELFQRCIGRTGQGLSKVVKTMLHVILRVTVLAMCLADLCILVSG